MRKLLFLLLISVAFSSSLDSSYFYKSAVNNMIIAFGISGLLIALYYMAGSFLNSPKLMAFSKKETYELIMTLFIFIFFTLWFGGQGAFYNLGFNFIGESKTFLSKLIGNLSMYYTIIEAINFILYTLYSFQINLGTANMGVMFLFQVGPGFKPLITASSYASQLIQIVLGEFVGIRVLFVFIERWLIPYVLPFALLFRSVPFTRSIGNILIAISFALFIIYPFMFYIESKIYEKVFSNVVLSSFKNFFSDFLSIIPSDTGGKITVFAVGIVFSFLKNPWYTTLFFLSGVIIEIFKQVLYQVAYITVIFGGILPFINIFVTLSLAREISKFLGTDIILAALEKVL